MIFIGRIVIVFFAARPGWRQLYVDGYRSRDQQFDAWRLPVDLLPQEVPNSLQLSHEWRECIGGGGVVGAGFGST